MLVIALVAIGYQPPAQTSADARAVVSSSQSAATQPSVDQLVATNVAAAVAESTDLPVAYNVANLSQSLTSERTLAQTDTNVISKPQIVQPTADSRVAVSYKTSVGDTIPTIAQKYHLAPQTIKWANNLTSDAIEPNRVLKILPVDGVLYTVQSGDTKASIANHFRADLDRLTSFNDLEQGQPKAGSQIIIPGGVLSNSERPGYIAPQVTNAYDNSIGGYGVDASLIGQSVGNRYAWGNCTWYAYERRAELGRPVGSFWGNANTWAYYAAASGYRVDGNPAPGDVMANGGGNGHVAVVESVNRGVSITISEMNGYRFGGGFARIGRGNISWAEATSGMFQYIH